MDRKEWLWDIVAGGIQRLVALSPDYSPASDMIPLTCGVWYEVIHDFIGKPEQEKDQKRVADAFKVLFKTVKKWPTPAMLLEVMDRRAPKYRNELPYKNDVPRSKEEITKARATISKLFDSLDGKRLH